MLIIQRLLTWLRPWLPSRGSGQATDPAHTRAAKEQVDLLTELDLLLLGQALQEEAERQGGYAGQTFDLMITIADQLERDHGWQPEQSDAWLERMGLWDWDE